MQAYGLTYSVKVSGNSYNEKMSIISNAEGPIRLDLAVSPLKVCRYNL